MAELMIAVVILGIGMLITSSMFPIAWFKARAVAEAATVPAIAEQAEMSVKFLCRVNGPPNSPKGQVSSFFPGDWFANLDGQDQWLPGYYPDTRVHVLNLGNFLPARFYDSLPGLGETEPDILKSSARAPVADNPWAMDDNLLPRLSDPLYVDQSSKKGNLFNPPTANPQRPPIHHRQIVANARMFPPMEAQPDPNAIGYARAQTTLWQEQFETRRYCWSVLYRFTQMPGPHWTVVQKGEAGGAAEATAGTAEAMNRSRMLSMYYVTLKRPAGARYARQDATASSTTFANPPSAPRALPIADAVLLPVPWRIEAKLLKAPKPGDSPQLPSGIPSEIEVNDVVLAGIIQEDTRLFDERTGQVFKVTQVRDAGFPRTIYTLDAEYRDADLLKADYSPPANSDEVAYNFEHEWMFSQCVPVAGPNCFGVDPEANIFQTPGGTSDHQENNPAQRFYWVFPPPVESVDGNGVPVFDGTPPVVGVEIRQLVLSP